MDCASLYIYIYTPCSLAFIVNSRSNPSLRGVWSTSFFYIKKEQRGRERKRLFSDAPQKKGSIKYRVPAPNGKRTGSLSLVSTPCFPNHPCIPSFSHLTAVSIPSIPFYSSSSPSPGLLSLPLTPSFRIGILIPCVAKHLLRSVLSMTPGNFFAEKTSNLSLKHEARTGAEAVLRVWAAVGEPTFTKFIFSLSRKVSLGECAEMIQVLEGGGDTGKNPRCAH